LLTACKPASFRTLRRCADGAGSMFSTGSRPGTNRISRAASRQNSSSSSEDSDFGAGDKLVAGALTLPDDPRTISQIKRSRIDLDRRYVFLCPTSLSKHFDVLPSQAKDSALLVFKCSRDWLVRDPAEIRRARVTARVESGIAKNLRPKKVGGNAVPRAALSAAACHSEFSKEFMQWVLTKEKEGCVFWFKPEKDFQKLSKFFEEKIDPMSEQPYRPLLLEPQWWRVSFLRTSARYCANPSMVIANISERSLACVDKRDVAIPALQELIYQSNPTLEPICKWPHAPSMRFLPKVPTASKDYVGQYASFKGYIDIGSPRAGLDQAGSSHHQDQARISSWPQCPRERLDNLHHCWQLEDAICQRRSLQGFARTAPPFREGGGLFGLGFGLHNGRSLTADPMHASARRGMVMSAR